MASGTLDIDLDAITANWRALEAAGLDGSAPVSLRLKNVPYELALRYILRDALGWRGAFILAAAIFFGQILFVQIGGEQFAFQRGEFGGVRAGLQEGKKALDA